MTVSATLQFIDQLKTSEVRLLARSVFAPPLLSLLSIKKNTATTANNNTRQIITNDYRTDTIFKLDKDYKHWLTRLDSQPDKLQKHLANSPTKLGLYHENLWAYFLSNSGRTILLAQNLKVRNENRDIGELDFIYQHQDYGIIHLELACKYYLSSNASSVDWGFWLGPNRADSLDRKINHSIMRQLPLSDNSLAQALINQCLADQNIPIPNVITKQLHVGGRLFYGRDTNYDLAALPPSPDLINASHLRGLWLTYNQWCDILRQDNNVIAIAARKPNWLDSSVNLVSNGESANNALSNFGAEEPCLLACKSAQLGAGFVFIVPNNWNETNG